MAESIETAQEVSEDIESVLPNEELVLTSSNVNGMFRNLDITTLTVGELAKHLIYPWWSRKRDIQLRELARNNDYLAIGIYNAITRITGILPSIIPIEKDNDLSIFQAEVSTLLLQKAWLKQIPGFLRDVLEQDNGGVMEVLGGGGASTRPLEPVEVSPGIFLPATGLRTLDSQQCTRTGDPEFPIIVKWVDGEDYTMHYSRIIEYAQLPSTDPKKHGVGFCAVSRVLQNSMQGREFDQIVLDTLASGLTGEIIFASPFESDALESAYKKAEQRQTSEGTKYNKYVFVGVNNFDGDLKIIRVPLRRIPEGMTKSEVVSLFMFLVAASISIDAREIWSAPISGNAKSDAEQQNQKTKNKFIKEWLLFAQSELAFKFSPISCEPSFDYKDETELLESLTNRDLLADVHDKEIQNGTISVAVAQNQMVEYGFMTTDDLDTIRTQPSAQELETARTLLRAPSVQTAEISNAKLIAKSFDRLKKSPEVKQAEDYQFQLDIIITRYRQGFINRDQFIVEVGELTIDFTIIAYTEGSQKTIGELDSMDQAILIEQVSIMNESIEELADKVIREGWNYENSSNLWTNTIERIYQLSWLFRVDDPLLQWNLGLAEHCNTCKGLAGQIKRKSEWLSLGLWPRAVHGVLACGGWLCKCFWTEVTA